MRNATFVCEHAPTSCFWTIYRVGWDGQRAMVTQFRSYQEARLILRMLRSGPDNGC